MWLYRRVFKRALDLIVLLATAPIWLPLLAIVGVAVLATLGRPVLFRQLRPGRSGELFTLLKFRTMREPEPGQDASDEARLTAFGGVLRRLSLDELPGLLNVARGDMSLVGPRPLLPEYLTLYTREQARRHEVRPGLTGWAQVNGRNEQPWEERLRMDVWYVDNVSLGLDLKILGKTVPLVLRREGIAAPDHPTMPRFEGTDDA